MDTFLHILKGLSVGLQAFTCVYVFRILIKKYTPTSPYMWLLAAMLIILTVKLDFFIHFLNPNLRLIMQFFTSVTLLLGFMNIYILLNKKYEL